MRLIEADKLKTVKSIQSADFNTIKTIQKWINSAPTVDAIPRSEIKAALEEMEELEETEFHMPNTDYEAYAVAYHCVEILKKHMEVSDADNN